MLRTTPEFHAYWLVPIKDPSSSYVDLLITSLPIDKVGFSVLRSVVGKGTGDLLALPAIWVRTYQRDSLWNTDFCPFKPAYKVTGVSIHDHTLTWQNKRHRYEETTRDKLIQLLEKPTGTVPIHRMYGPIAGAETLVTELLLLLTRSQDRRP